MKVAAAIVAVLALSLPAVALAHAELLTSDPADGATITTPYTLTATFDDELTPDGSSIVVENANGAQVAAGTVDPADAHEMTAELPELPAGTYTVRWTAVSADDAAVERGTYTFNVGDGATSPTPAPTPVEPNGSSNDTLIAVGLAAVVIIAVVAYIFIRGRR